MDFRAVDAEPNSDAGFRPEWKRIEPMDRRAALDLPLLCDTEAPGPDAGGLVLLTVIERAEGGRITIRLEDENHCP